MSSSNSEQRKMQGFKVTDNKRVKKYGIAANSLQMLREKASAKFQIDDCHLYLAKDGFEVTEEDYFLTLQPQTLFVVAGPDQEIRTESELAFEKLKRSSPMIRMTDMFYDFIERHPDKFKEMVSEFETRNSLTSDKTHLSLRYDHEEWFEETDERCKTKEDVLAKRAQDRIRGYYYRVKEEIIKSKLYRSNQKAKNMFEKILEKFRYLLIGCDYFSMLFNRKHPRKYCAYEDQTDARPLPNKRLRQAIKEYTSKTEFCEEWSVSLCDDEGEFVCQGSYGRKGVCTRNHRTNPYSTKESFILFQIWNLDHQIELTRTIIPSIIENVRSLLQNPNQLCPEHKKKVVDLSIIEYFLELFSAKNLRLVHIVCHDKASRENKSNGRLICEKCDEYKILKDITDISCPEVEEDEIDGFPVNFNIWLL